MRKAAGNRRNQPAQGVHDDHQRGYGKSSVERLGEYRNRRGRDAKTQSEHNCWKIERWKLIVGQNPTALRRLCSFVFFRFEMRCFSKYVITVGKRRRFKKLAAPERSILILTGWRSRSTWLRRRPVQLNRANE
jgi:hypothetical protein